MEGPPPSEPAITEKNSSEEKKGSRSRSKKKKAENLGNFIVETPAEQKRRAAAKSESLWQHLLNEDKESKSEDKEDKPLKSEKAPKAESNDKTPELDGEAPLEHLSEVETEAVNKNFARVRHDEVAEELKHVDPDTQEALGAEMAEAFYAKTEASGDPEASQIETLAEYGIDDPEAIIREAEAVLIPDETAAEIEGEGEPISEAVEETPGETVIDMLSPIEGELPLSEASEEASEVTPDEDDETAIPPTAAATTATSVPTQATPQAGGGNRGAGVPPPPGPGGYNFGPNTPFGGGPGGYDPNFYPSAIPLTTPNYAHDPNVISEDAARANERQAMGRGLLVGGIVGYLIGRRRGRIKTEKRLLPVQKKLEKEVVGLEKKLSLQEATLRRIAQEQSSVRPRHKTETIAAAPLKPAQREQIAPAAKPNRPAGVVTVVEKRSSAPNAHELHQVQVPLERIGHVLIAAEALPAVWSGSKRAEQSVAVAPTPAPEIAPVKTKAEKATIEKHVETMSRQELMELSERVIVDGASLRQVYETRLVGERGLRRLVTEYLRGGDIKRALRRELVEREIDFERDPILRDRARASMSGGGATALGTLLRQAGALPVVADQPSTAKQAAGNAEQPEAKQPKSQLKQHVADISIIGVIIVLLLIILFLVVR